MSRRADCGYHAPSSLRLFRLHTGFSKLFSNRSKQRQPDSGLEGTVAQLAAKVQRLESVGNQLSQLQSLLEMQGLRLNIPPAHLQIRVGGAYNENFFRLGDRLGRSVESMLSLVGKSFYDFKSILDFGCGCGRVVIPLSLRLKNRGKLFGSDIDPEAIAWCQRHIKGVGGFEVNPHKPPSPFGDGQFDLIYGISVFTHLPEAMQFAWLEDLHRICADGAHLVLTFHGERHYAKMEGPLRKKLDKHGFAYSDAPKGTTDGLPDFYQTSFHKADYVRENWSRYFEVLEIKPEQVGTQDAVLLRKA